MEIIELKVRDVRANLKKVSNMVEFEGKCVIMTSDRTPKVAIISIEDLNRLQEIETQSTLSKLRS